MKREINFSQTLLFLDLPFLVNNAELPFLLNLQFGIEETGVFQNVDQSHRFILDALLIKVNDPQIAKHLLTEEVKIKGLKVKVVLYKGEKTRKKVEGPLLKKAVYFKGVSLTASKREIEQALSSIKGAEFERIILPLKTISENRGFGFVIGKSQKDKVAYLKLGRLFTPKYAILFEPLRPKPDHQRENMLIEAISYPPLGPGRHQPNRFQNLPTTTNQEIDKNNNFQKKKKKLGNKNNNLQQPNLHFPSPLLRTYTIPVQTGAYHNMTVPQQAYNIPQQQQQVQQNVNRKKQLVSRSYYLSNYTIEKVDRNHTSKNIRIQHIPDDQQAEPTKMYYSGLKNGFYFFRDSRIRKNGFFHFKENGNRRALAMLNLHF